MVNSLPAPRAVRTESVREFHGDAVVDPYEWLREKSNPDVIAHLEAEHAYTLERTANVQPLADEIYAEIVARTDESDSSVPGLRRHGGHTYWYYERTVEGKDYGISCRVSTELFPERPIVEGPLEGEEILLDSNVEAEGVEFFSLGALTVSPDGSKLAYLVDTTGDERYQVRVKTLSTGAVEHLDLTDVLDVCWVNDEWLFYVKVDDAWRPFQVWRHQLGTSCAEDALVLQEDDERFWLGVERSRDGSYVLLDLATKTTGEVWLVPTTDPQAEPICVSPRQEGLAYSVEVAGDQLLILHDRNCVDFELASVPVDALDSPWTTVIAGVEGVRLAHVAAYASYVVVALRRNGVTGIHVMKRTPDGFEPGRDVPFDGEFYTVWPRFEADYETVENRVLYTSLVTPMTTLLLNLDSLESVVLKQTKVLDDPVRGAYDPSQYVQKREWATAADGTKIPISLFHHKDLVLDGSNPCLLYGYGSYESTSDPAFSLRKLACVERGMVFAIAHVRGGGDMGRRWYNEGKALQKKNTFSDFVACAQHLIDVGYTQPARLAAEGRSAGGLLMGAITNLAPELFRAVHAGVAFVDPLTSITMPELPLTIGEWEEWGDPYHDPQVYAYMKEYAPYENINPSRPYPAILATTSLNDTRVLYVEPAKWIARLRHELPDDGRDRLLHIEMVAGHGGVSGRYGAWKQDAYELAWLLTEVSS